MRRTAARKRAGEKRAREILIGIDCICLSGINQVILPPLEQSMSRELLRGLFIYRAKGSNFSRMSSLVGGEIRAVCEFSPTIH